MAFEQNSSRPGLQKAPRAIPAAPVQQRNLTPSPTASPADNVPNAGFEGELFVNPFGTPSTESVVSSTQYVIMEPKTVKEALTDPAWIESMQEELHQFIRLDALYGLKQASRAWYDELSTFLLQNGFSKGTIDLTLFTRCFDDDILVEQVYVNQSPSGIFINHSKYVHEILKKYGLNTSDIIGTPMDIKDKLDLDQIGTLVDAKKYRSMIGALMYLTSSRPDIVHATCDSGFELTGFSDADYAGCKDTFKSTSGGAQFLGEKLVSWSSKKQDCTSLSTVKLEYVSLSAYCAQVL
nr:hypothetical protein [Tanacetum cinerariifolium]